MKKNKVLWLAAFFAFLLWAFLKYSNESEKRNRIEFVDSFKLVQDNILALDSLIKYANAKCNADYAISFEGNTVLMMNHKIDDRLKPRYFCSSAKISADKFKKIINVLKRNNISGVYSMYNTNVCVFGYRDYEGHTEFAALREIIIDKNDNKEIMKLNNYFLDKKDELILMHPIYTE